MEPWMSLLQTFGLAVVVLFAIGIALWKASRWVGAEIIIPLRDTMISALTSFFSRMERGMDKMEDTLNRIDSNVSNVLRVTSQQVVEVKRQAERVAEASDKIQQKLTNGSGH